MGAVAVRVVQRAASAAGQATRITKRREAVGGIFSAPVEVGVRVMNATTEANEITSACTTCMCYCIRRALKHTCAIKKSLDPTKGQKMLWVQYAAAHSGCVY